VALRGILDAALQLEESGFNIGESESLARSREMTRAAEIVRQDLDNAVMAFAKARVAVEREEWLNEGSGEPEPKICFEGADELAQTLFDHADDTAIGDAPPRACRAEGAQILRARHDDLVYSHLDDDENEAQVEPEPKKA
jgi:hypothetical protein